jgi:DNA-binding NtrC family response regulator
MTDRLNILVVDDEPRVLDEIEEFLLNKKYHVFKAAAPSEAFKQLTMHPINILILDVKLPEMSGLDVLKQVKSQYPDIEVIMISGHGDMETVIQAMRSGASDYFPKPFRLIDIDNAILRTRRYLEIAVRLKAANSSVDILSRKLLENIGSQLIGNSAAMKHLVSMMTKVSQTDNTSVLILGESGTGKELVAHGVHYLSKRAHQPFYSVNCSAIPETLFESEFFGHKKGAFTGAFEDKSGWFEIADNGTLFLDEISDMPLHQQAKLLRVLEERKVSKLGSKQSKKVDVRVIAASNNNLELMSEQNKFRLDLYHRLSIFIIEIPPLRDRVEDIPVLVDHYVKLYAKEMGKTITQIDPGVFQMMKEHLFPGNVRELKNIVERAVIMCERNTLLPEHFTILGKSSLNGKSSKNGKNGFSMDNPDELSNEISSGLTDTNFDLEESVKLLIKNALKACDNNKAKTAELLNITWQSLDRRMKKYGLE